MGGLLPHARPLPRAAPERGQLQYPLSVFPRLLFSAPDPGPVSDQAAEHSFRCAARLGRDDAPGPLHQKNGRADRLLLHRALPADGVPQQRRLGPVRQQLYRAARDRAVSGARRQTRSLDDLRRARLRLQAPGGIRPARVRRAVDGGPVQVAAFSHLPRGLRGAGAARGAARPPVLGYGHALLLADRQHRRRAELQLLVDLCDLLACRRHGEGVEARHRRHYKPNANY